MASAPGAIGFQVFELAPVRVVDPAVQHQLSGATLDLRERDFAQHGHRIVIKLPPADWIEVAEQAGRIVIPLTTIHCEPATRASPAPER